MFLRNFAMKGNRDIRNLLKGNVGFFKVRDSTPLLVSLFLSIS